MYPQCNAEIPEGSIYRLFVVPQGSDFGSFMYNFYTCRFNRSMENC